ncbi:hypothetical protein Tco_0133489 [Tanacetum coccineum]
MMTNNLDSIQGDINNDLYIALSKFFEQDKQAAPIDSCRDANLKNRSYDDQDDPENREGEKRYKKQKFERYVNIHDGLMDILLSTEITYGSEVQVQKTGSIKLKDGYELFGNRFMSKVEYDYNMDQMTIAMSDDMDWARDYGLGLDGKEPLSLEEMKRLSYRGKISATTIRKVYLDLKITFVDEVKVDVLFEYGVLESITVTRADKKKYTFKESDFSRLNLNDIEDMKRVEDVQLGVESYQKSLNIIKPQKSIPKIKHYPAYTMCPKPFGVVYEGRDEKKRFIRDDEVYKFCNRAFINGKTLAFIMSSYLSIEYDHVVMNSTLLERRTATFV